MSGNIVVGIFLPTIFAFFAIAMYCVWTWNREARHTLMFSLGFALLGVAYVVSNFLVLKSNPLNPLICHPLNVTALGLLVAGACRRMSIALETCASSSPSPR